MILHQPTNSIKKILRNGVFNCLCKQKKITFKIAKSPEELNAAYRLAWQIYSEEGYINPEDYTKELYSDKYDKYSTNFLAFVDGKAVGILRIIFHSPLGFYIEKDFPIIPPSIETNKIAEISRLSILKEYRGGKRLISFGILKEAFRFSQQKGITHWYALMGEKLKNSFEKYGVEINLLPYKKLTAEHLEERKNLPHYYNKVKPLPYIIFLESMKKLL
jgi:N-acyl-L-homoserine lactone synthetase